MKAMSFFKAVSVVAFFPLISPAQGRWDNIECVNNVTELFRDGDTMWVSTFGGGVFKFDSKTMTQSNLSKANTIIPGDSINEVTKDRDGNLWIATETAGLARIGSSNNKVFSTANSRLPSNTVNSIAVDSSNVIWISTEKGIVTLVHDSISSIFNFPGTTSGSYKNTSYIGTRIIVDKNNNKIAGTSKGLMIIDNNRNSRYYSTTNSCIKGNYIMYCAIDKSQNIWLSTYHLSEGIFSSLSGTGVTCLGTTECFSISKSGYGYSGLLSSNNPTCIAIGPDNLKWIGSDDNGISVINDTNALTINSSFFNQSNSDLSARRVQPINFDSDSRVWVGTRRSGLFVSDSKNTRHLTLGHNKLPCNYTKQVVIDKNGKRWFLHEDENFFCAGYTAITGTDGTNWNVFDSESDGLPDCTIQILKDPSGMSSLLVLSHGLLLTIENDSLKRILTSSISVDSNTTITCYPFSIIPPAFEDNGTAWFSCSSGVLKWTQRKTWNYYDAVTASFLNGHKSKIAIDSKGTLWLSSRDSGLITYNGESWRLFKYSNQNNGDVFNDAIPDNKGGCWTSIYNSSSGTHHYFVHFDGSRYKDFDKGTIKGIAYRQKYVDVEGRLWLLTTKGIYMSDRDTLYFFNSGNSDLQAENFLSSCTGPDGTPYFCGFDPNFDVHIYSYVKGRFELKLRSPFSRIATNDIIMDEKNNLYMATSNGIITYTPDLQTPAVTTHTIKSAKLTNVSIDGLNRISISIAESGEVWVEIISINGAVFSRYNAGRLAAGNHVFSLDPFPGRTKFPNGCFFIRIQTKNASVVQPWINVR